MARVITLLTFLIISSTSFGQYYKKNIQIQGKIKNTNVPLNVNCIATTSWSLDSVYTYWTSTSDSSGNFSGTIDSMLIPPTYAFFYITVNNCHGGIDSFQFWPINNDTINAQLNFCAPLKDQCDARFNFGISKTNFLTPRFHSYSKASVHRRETYSMGDGNTLVNPGSLSPTIYYWRTFDHTYPKYKSDTFYEVSLYLYDSLTQCRDTQRQTVYIKNQCNLRCYITAEHANDSDANLTLTAPTQTGNMSQYKYYWYFNDTFQSNDTFLIVKAPIGDSIKVNLRIEDTVSQCIASAERFVVPGPCHKSFSYQIISDSVSYKPKLELTNTSLKANHFKFLWKVRALNSSTIIGQSYSKDYSLVLPGNGKYVVVLQKLASECMVLSKLINVQLPPLCDANFSAVISTDSVYVISTSTNRRKNFNHVSFKWEFGDGDSLYTTNHIVSHGYKDTGYYKILMTLYDSTTKCTSAHDLWIHIDSLRQTRCGADFSYNFNGLRLDLTSLEDSSNYYFDIWQSNKNGGYFYHTSKNQPGTISCNFWDNDLLVCNSISKTNINCQAKECRILRSPVQPCNAEFEVVKDTSVQFGIKIVDRSSAGRKQDYRWYFGDGDSSTSRTPTHDYNSFGKYNLCLHIFGYMDTAQKVYCHDEFCKEIGMDSTGKLLKKGAFSITVVDGTVSVITPERNLAQLYPNPNNGIFYIDNISGNMPVIRVFDIRGVEVPITVLKEQSGVKIQLEDPTTGVYLLEVVSDGLRSTARVLVKE